MKTELNLCWVECLNRFCLSILLFSACVSLQSPAFAQEETEPEVAISSSDEEDSQQEEEPEEEKSEIDQAWEDLAANDTVKAARAILFFANNDEQTLEYFDSRLIPLSLDAETFESLSADLFGEDEEKAEAAHEQFEYLDPRLHMPLPKLMEELAGDELKMQRMVAVLSGYSFGQLDGKNVSFGLTQAATDEQPAMYNFRSAGSSWWAEAQLSRLGAGGWSANQSWARATRAMLILENIGGDSALEILSRMTRGHDEATPTLLAREFATNMKRKNKENK